MKKRALDIIAYMENDLRKSSLKDLSDKIKVSKTRNTNYFQYDKTID